MKLLWGLFTLIIGVCIGLTVTAYVSHDTNYWKPNLMLSNIDSIAAIGSYYTAAATYVITAVVLVITVVGLYYAATQYALPKQIEEKQKKFENMLNMFEILSEVRGQDKHGVVSIFLKLACLDALHDYPEFHHTFVVMYDSWLKDPPHLYNENIVAAARRLVRATRPRRRLFRRFRS